MGKCWSTTATTIPKFSITSSFTINAPELAAKSLSASLQPRASPESTRFARSLIGQMNSLRFCLFVNCVISDAQVIGCVVSQKTNDLTFQPCRKNE